MLKSYFKLALRNIIGSGSNSLINVSGLALGITCAVLIFSLVSYHLSFDNFHHDSDRIFRFVTEQHRDEVSYVGSVPPAFGKAFREDYTYAEKVARLCTAHEALISIEHNGNLKKFVDDAAFADAEFFEIFNFPLLHGNIVSALTAPRTAIITERIARKFFGDAACF